MATYVKRDNGNDYAHNQDIVGALVNRKCVCKGFVSAFKYLCDRLGDLEVMMVVGDIKGLGLHAWNMAKVDGEFYHIDVTWDDGKIYNKEQSNVHFLIPWFLLKRKRTITSAAPPPSGTSINYLR